MVQHHAQVHLAIPHTLLLLLQFVLRVEMKLHTAIVALLFLVHAEMILKAGPFFCCNAGVTQRNIAHHGCQ